MGEKNRAHIIYKSRDMTFICNICGRNFSYKKNLSAHLNRIKKCQPPDEVVTYECETCGKIYSTKDSLRKHVNKKLKCSASDIDTYSDMSLCTSNEESDIDELQSQSSRASHASSTVNQTPLKFDNLDLTQLSKKELQIVNFVMQSLNHQNGSTQDPCSTPTTTSSPASTRSPTEFNHNYAPHRNYRPSTPKISATINNVINNNTTTNNTMNNMYLISYINNNFPDVKNIEDCVKHENVTQKMLDECKDMYFIDGAAYIIKKLCDLGEDQRPIHCTDPSRNNYVYKTKGDWKIDAGGEEIKACIIPVVDMAYNRVHLARIADHKGDITYIANMVKDMNTRNVGRVCGKAMRSIKTSFLAKNLVTRR